MPTELKNSIRHALAGSSSQSPVDAVALYKLGKKADVDAALGELLANSELNTAWTMKDGVQKTLYWLTGVVGPFKSPWQLNQEKLKGIRQLPAATLRTPCADQSGSSGSENTTTSKKVKPIASISPAQKKEIPVNTTAKPHGGKQPSELNTAIYNKIVEHPGITQAALIKHAQHKFQDATEKQIKKTIFNLAHSSKKIRVEGKRGNYTYHLNTGVSQLPAKPVKPAKPSKVVAAGKVVFGDEAAALRGDPQPAATPASSPVVKQEAEQEFELLLSDENCLHINLGGNRFRLNPKQLARLDTFLARVLTDGVRLADGAPA